MRRPTTSFILSVAALVSVATCTQTRSASLLQANLRAQQDQMLVETVAATLYGGEGQVFAELRDQAVDKIAYNFFNTLKKDLVPLAVKVGGAALTNMRKNLIGFSEVSSAKLDGDVAEYILSQLSVGNRDFIAALAQAQLNQGVQGQAFAEVDNAIKQSLWEKIKNFFSRKKEAQTQSEVATINGLMNAEISSYLRAQSEAIFDDLEAKLIRAQQVDVEADADFDGVDLDNVDEDVEDFDLSGLSEEEL